MKRLFFTFAALVACHTAMCDASNEKSVLALPSKHYVMDGVENRLFIQTFVCNAHLQRDIVRFEGDCSYMKGGVLKSYAAVKSPKSGERVEVKLYDAESFEVKESKSVLLCVGDSTSAKGDVRVQFLGDSFTKGCYFSDAFLQRGYVPGVKLVGTRRVPGYEGHYHEGRGGWTVAKYFSNDVEDRTFYNPFFQPAGDLRYWGSTEFWKIACALNKDGGKGESFSIRYNCGDYDTSRFGEDGYMLSPRRGDVMYDYAQGRYVGWSRGEWREVEEPKEWDFDYVKYLEMWGFESPDFLVVMLGLNDYRDESLPLDFELWNKRIERMRCSYLDAVPEGRLLLSTPCTSCGVLNNESGAFTTRQNAMMWYVRENIIRHFDGRESERVYVVDASVVIDNENGYRMKDGVQVGNPHPYPNYPQLGVPIAACVQYYRDK